MSNMISILCPCVSSETTLQLHLSGGWLSTRHSCDGEQGLMGRARGPFLVSLCPVFERPSTATWGGSALLSFFAAIWLTMNKVTRSMLAEVVPCGEAGRAIPKFFIFCCNFLFSKNSWGRRRHPQIWLYTCIDAYKQYLSCKVMESALMTHPLPFSISLHNEPVPATRVVTSSKAVNFFANPDISMLAK